jgi:hypothetical protein
MNTYPPVPVVNEVIFDEGRLTQGAAFFLKGPFFVTALSPVFHAYNF